MVHLPSEKTTVADPLTGHRIHRFTTRDNNASPYFNSHAWTPDSEWFFFLRTDAAGDWLMAAEYATGDLRRLAGPFGGPAPDDRVVWASLNAIPGTRAATFIAANALWRVDLDGQVDRIAALPGPSGGDTDVSTDGRWHVLPIFRTSAAGREALATTGWAVDDVIDRHGMDSELCRVDLATGAIETLWTEERALVDHISVNPRDPDTILFCHEGPRAYRYGRMFLRRVGEPAARALRDQTSGRVWVTHERWFPDGKHIAYHGEYRDPPRPERQFYVGIFDVARNLPREHPLADPSRQPWHSIPSPDGTLLISDYRNGGAGLAAAGFRDGGIDFLHLDATGQCSCEPLCSLHSDDSPLPPYIRGQWRELDPVWAPDGRKVLFRLARHGAVHVYAIEVPEEETT